MQYHEEQSSSHLSKMHCFIIDLRVKLQTCLRDFAPTCFAGIFSAAPLPVMNVLAVHSYTSLQPLLTVPLSVMSFSSSFNTHLWHHLLQEILNHTSFSCN